MQHVEYQMTPQVHLTGGAEALNEIARDGWRIIALQPGAILWERPAATGATAETAATGATTETTEVQHG